MRCGFLTKADEARNSWVTPPGRRVRRQSAGCPDATTPAPTPGVSCPPAGAASYGPAPRTGSSAPLPSVPGRGVRDHCPGRLAHALPCSVAHLEGGTRLRGRLGDPADPAHTGVAEPHDFLCAVQAAICHEDSKVAAACFATASPTSSVSEWFRAETVGQHPRSRGSPGGSGQRWQ
jgi:hypothetical protein